MKKTTISHLLFAFILFLCTSCGEGESPKKISTDGTGSTTAASDKVAKPKADFKVGDEIQFSNYIFQVTKSEVGKIYDEMFQPDQGKKYVAVEVLITNNGQEKVDYNFLTDFKVSDENGYEYDIAPMSGKEPSLASGDINPGRKVRGWLSFEVDKNAKKFEFIYTPGFFSEQKFYISLDK